MTQKNSFIKFDENGQKSHDYKRLADSITTLPTLRSNIVELVQSTENSFQTNIPIFVENVKKDQSLVAKVLKVARASKYAQLIQVDTISDAIQVLGVDKLRDIALRERFLGNFLNPNPYACGFDWKAFWKHANAVGIISSIIAKTMGKTDHERFYTAGLLHDMGKMGAFCLDEKKMLKVSGEARNLGLSFIEIEKKLGTPRHDLLGEAICESWELPDYLSKVCRFHHTYFKDRRIFHQSDQEQRKQCNHYIDVVILANFCAKQLKQGYSGHSKIEEPSRLILKNLNFPESLLEKITPTILAELKEGSFIDDLFEAA